MDDNNRGCGCLFYFLVHGVYQIFVYWGWIGVLIVCIILIILIIAIGYWGSLTSTNNSSSSHPSPPPPVNISVPDDLDNILIEISQGEIKDPYSCEIFKPGEQVYLCHVHRLAYHQDSWQELGCKCIHCEDGNKTKLYTLPTPINLEQDKITWEDIN